uniref:Uncharacterized protein n=1 Tax=Arundo donax TaxID=35708 RepID=A0A0A8YLT1_ARUDO
MSHVHCCTCPKISLACIVLSISNSGPFGIQGIHGHRETFSVLQRFNSVSNIRP